MKFLKLIPILFIFFGNVPYKNEVKAEIKNPQDFRVLSNESKKLSISNVEYFIKEGDKYIKNEDFEKAKDFYLDARKLAKQLASFYSDLNSSFKGIDARIPNEMQRKGKQTLQILAETNNPKDFRVLSNESKKLSISNVEYFIKEGDKYIENGDFEKAKDSYLDARNLAKQLASFYSDLNSSFKGIDARIPNEMQRKGKQTLQILAKSNERLASLYIKNEKPEVAVPLLVETIRIMSPNSPEGKEAYERLIQLGFVETKYKG